MAVKVPYCNNELILKLCTLLDKILHEVSSGFVLCTTCVKTSRNTHILFSGFISTFSLTPLHCSMTQMMVAIATGQAGHCATNLVETARNTAQDHARTLHQATVAMTVHGLAATRRFPSAMTDLAKVCSCKRHASLFFLVSRVPNYLFFQLVKNNKNNSITLQYR